MFFVLGHVTLFQRKLHCLKIVHYKHDNPWGQLQLILIYGCNIIRSALDQLSDGHVNLAFS